MKPDVDRARLERYRRDFQTADWAGKLGIPLESLFRNETVAAYVGVVRDVAALMDGLEYQATADGVREGSSLNLRFQNVGLLLKSTRGILRPQCRRLAIRRFLRLLDFFRQSPILYPLLLFSAKFLNGRR